MQNEVMEQFHAIQANMKFEKNIDIKSNLSTAKVKLGENVIHDAELIESFSDSTSILDDVCAFSAFGTQSRPYVAEILTNLVTSKSDLWLRQRFFEDMNLKEASRHLTNAERNFDSIKWILTQRDEEVSDVLSSVLFRWPMFRALNFSGVALELKNMYSIYLSPIIGVTSPVVYFVLPLVIMKVKYKINIPVKYYMQSMYALTSASLNQKESGSLRNLTAISYGTSIFFYIQGVYNTISNAISTKRICSLLSSHVRNTVAFIESSNALSAMFSSNPFYQLRPISGVDHPVAGLGSRLRWYDRLRAMKAEVCRSTDAVFVADAFVSIKKYIEAKGLRRASFDFTSSTPRYAFDKCWHVSLSKDNVSRNSLSNSNAQRNCIITGPNASGKSTFMKAVLVNVLLSQTIAYCGAENFALTPFDYIGSQICVPDCKGKESLFEAEMTRSKRNLEYVVDNPTSKCILFLDEIFNSTNPIEGICGSHSIVRNLGKRPNVIVFLTTHYDYICDLNRDKYALYKFDCDIEGESIRYDYEIKEGINKQLVALDILKMNGFNRSIIHDAAKLKDYLCRNPSDRRTYP